MPVFDTPAPISATVDIVLGDIRFAASDRADTVVEVHPVDPYRELDVKAAADVEIAFTDGRLTVRHPRLRTAFTRKYGSVRVLVQVPTGSDVQGDTAEGEYLVQGTVGSCRLKNAIGDIRVARAGDVRLRTTAGKVIVDHATGRADVSGNGDIRIRRVDGGAVVKNIGGDSRIGEVAGDLRAGSATGDISVDIARASVTAKIGTGHIRVGEAVEGFLDLDTAIGRIEVGVGRATAVELDARTSLGRVQNYLDAPASPERAVKVRARANGGDIILRHARAEQGGYR